MIFYDQQHKDFLADQMIYQQDLWIDLIVLHTNLEGEGVMWQRRYTKLNVNKQQYELLFLKQWK